MISPTQKHAQIRNLRNLESSESPTYLQISPNNKRVPPKSKTPIFELKTEPNENYEKHEKFERFENFHKTPKNHRNFTFALGNSYEAPSYMILKNTVIDKQSYNNVFLEESAKWPILSKLNNQLTNINEFKIGENQVQRLKNEQKNEKSRQMFKSQFLLIFRPNKRKLVLFQIQSKTEKLDKKSQRTLKPYSKGIIEVY